MHDDPIVGDRTPESGNVKNQTQQNDVPENKSWEAKVELEVTTDGTASATPKRGVISHLVTVVTILTSTFLFALDNTVVANIQPAILNEFDGVAKLSWLGTGFALGAVSMLPWSKAYSMFDIKWLYITDVILFEAGSALSGAAPSMDSLIVGRVLAGFGGGGMYTGALVYLAVLSSPERRPFYMSLTAITWGVGTALGPVVGGGFAISRLSWRWAFYINLLVAALFAPSYLFVLPSANFMQGQPLAARLRKLDWIGLICFFGGTSCFTMAITFGGTVYAWNSASEIVLLVMSAVTLAINALVVKCHPGVSIEDRLYPGQFVKSPLLVNLQLQTFLSAGVLLGTTYYIPLFFQLTRGDSAILSVARLIPFIVMFVVFSPFNGFLVSKIGYYKPSYLVGAALMTLGTGLMLYIGPQTPVGPIYGFTILTGIGVGMCIQSGFAAAQALVPPTSVSEIVGFMGIAQDFGGVLVLGLTGTVYNNLAAPRITEVLRAAGQPGISTDIVTLLLTGTSNGALDSLDTNLQAEVIGQIVYALKGPWGTCFAAAAISFILSFFLGRQKVNVAYSSNGVS